MTPGAISQEIRRALRSIDGLPGVVICSPERRHPEGVDGWVIDVELTPADLGKRWPVPHTTRWVVGVSDDYPFGTIDIMPALVGGLERTFQHQLANVPGPYWRTGKICVGLHDAILGRLAKVGETMDPDERLRWHIGRAMAWLTAASRDELAVAGDPFELPDFSTETQPLLAFSETTANLARWSDPGVPRSGFVDVRSMRSPDRRGQVRRYAAAFHDRQGREVMPTPWGTYFPSAQVMPRGFWLRLPAVPVVEPWGAVRTWGDLRAAYRQLDIDLDAELAPLIDELRPLDGRRWRKRNRKFMATRVGMIGMPIGREIDGPATQMHWQAFVVPALAGSTSPAAKGFRPTRRNLWAIDQREAFSSTEPIHWLRSENWHIDQVSSRGALRPEVRDAQVAVIGAGSLGSLLAEVVVRLGIRQVVVIDGDRLHGGNLVRHTFTANDVEEPKAFMLAERLAAIHPAVRAASFHANFPKLSDEARTALAGCDVVFDTTGSDDVIASMSRYPWTHPMTFMSASLAADAERLFAFVCQGERFNAAAFFAWFDPIGEDERRRTPPLPMEGAGCWHPVMPARWDRIMALVGMVTPWIESRLAGSLPAPDQVIIDLPRLP